MLLEELPAAAAEALFADRIDLDRLRLHLNSVEDQVALRAWLGTAGLVAFVGDGARLARRSGVDDRPLVEGAVAFESPPSLAREVDLPHAGRIRGMGLGRGISLIVGGGFHGKSTLLKALQLGVYDHLPGDGRERVVCEPGACKIRAEDGRSIDRVDISAFVDLSALGRETRVFSTDNASGSTSQAANIVEALSGGCRTLLIDEDTTATNFMLRDERMRRLVGAEREPITPLVDQARELCDRHGVSIVLVTGGSGAYLDVADRVVMMDRYRPVDVSAAAAGLARAPLGAERDGGALDLAPTAARAWPAGRGPDPAAARIRVETMGTERLRVGECALDLARVEQLVDPGQLLAIGYLLLRLAAEPGTTAGLDGLSRLLEQSVADGLDGLSPFPGQPHGGLAAPRLAELYAAFNRMRA